MNTFFLTVFGGDLTLKQRRNFETKKEILCMLYALILHKPIDGSILSLLLLLTPGITIHTEIGSLREEREGVGLPLMAI